MPQKIERVQRGQPIRADHHNRLVDEVNRLNNLSGNDQLSVHRNANGIQLRVHLPSEPIPFQVSQDTPQNQGYVTALELISQGQGDNYIADQNGGEILIYDLANLIDASSPANPSSGGGPFPNYGSAGSRLQTNWAKKGFLGEARWEAKRGVWLVLKIEHIARFVNFSYAGPAGSSYAFGQPDTNLSVSQSWDGLDPTKTTFGSGNKTNQISLVNSPDNGYVVKSGDTGTAVWRDDLDNSTSWQYQVIDGSEVKC